MIKLLMILKVLSYEGFNNIDNVDENQNINNGQNLDTLYKYIKDPNEDKDFHLQVKIEKEQYTIIYRFNNKANIIDDDKFSSLHNPVFVMIEKEKVFYDSFYMDSGKTNTIN